MSTNEEASEEPFDFSFETRIDFTMATYTADHRKQPTQRRVSFEQGDNEMGQQSKNCSDSQSGKPPVTPRQLPKVEVDSPYTEKSFTPET